MYAVVLFAVIVALEALHRVVVQGTRALTADERRIAHEIGELRKEMNTLSPVDDFVRYSKCERKVMKLQKEWGSAQEEATRQPTPPIHTALSIARSVVPLLLVLWFWSEPLADLRPMMCSAEEAISTTCPPWWMRVLLFPLGTPHGFECGVVGASFFVFACKSVARSFI